MPFVVAPDFKGAKMTIRSRIVLAMAAVLFFATAAGATPITYNFEVTVTTGPLAPDVVTGTFTFDSSIIPSGGGGVPLSGLLTDLAFQWNGTAYTEATANTGFLNFDAAGGLTGYAFGNNCAPSFCAVFGGNDQWYASNGEFVYSLPRQPIFFNTVVLTQVTAPEPASLMLISLGVVGALVRRRLS